MGQRPGRQQFQVVMIQLKPNRKVDGEERPWWGEARIRGGLCCKIDYYCVLFREGDERAFILGILNFTCYVCRLLTRV